MTISAPEGSADGERLRSIALNRDLALGLQGRVAQLLALPAAGADGRDSAKLVIEHGDALKSVIDIEAHLDKQRAALPGGGAAGLDLAAARAEILAKLAGWLAEG